MKLQEVSIDSSSEILPIDAVITWVDGADPAHKTKLDAYLASIGGTRPRAASPARFHHSGELDYCITSLLRFAPWLRTIFIVTDEQIPDIYNKLKGTEYEHKVKIVDHKIIFSGYEQHLPTFNSSSILALLWRIPELAENFLFLNDDFALLRPVKPQDFFYENKVVLRGKWQIYAELNFSLRIKAWLKKINIFGKKNNRQKRMGYLACQELSAKHLGFEKYYFQVPHNPHPWRVSTLRDFYMSNPELLDFSISFPFRSQEQFIVDALAAHLEIKKGAALINNQFKTLQLKPAEQALLRIKRKLAKADDDINTVFVCVQNIENSSEEKQKIIFSWLDQRIGNIASVIDKVGEK